MLFVCTICLPVSIVSLYSNFRTQNLLLDSVKAMNDSTLKSIANNTNMYFEKYKSITDSILISDVIRDIALSENTNPHHHLIFDRLQFLLN